MLRTTLPAFLAFKWCALLLAASSLRRAPPLLMYFLTNDGNASQAALMSCKSAFEVRTNVNYQQINTHVRGTYHITSLLTAS
jgi:hypothetical protein